MTTPAELSALTQRCERALSYITAQRDPAFALVAPADLRALLDVVRESQKDVERLNHIERHRGNIYCVTGDSAKENQPPNLIRWTVERDEWRNTGKITGADEWTPTEGKNWSSEGLRAVVDRDIARTPTPEQGPR